MKAPEKMNADQGVSRRSLSAISVARLAAVGAALVLATATAARAETPAQICAARAVEGDYHSCAEAVAARPGDPELRRLYAISLQKAGRYDEALHEYARVAAMTPTRFRAQYELGWMLAFVRRYHEAVAPLERASRLRPAHTGVYRALTITFAMLKRPSNALRSALAGARLGDRIAMFDAARHYREGLGVAKDPRLALHWLTRAAEAGHVKAMDDLVRVYLYGELGETPDDAKAERWAAKARRARER